MIVTIVCNSDVDATEPEQHLLGFDIASGVPKFGDDGYYAMSFCDRRERADLEAALRNLSRQGYPVRLRTLDGRVGTPSEFGILSEDTGHSVVATNEVPADSLVSAIESPKGSEVVQSLLQPRVDRFEKAILVRGDVYSEFEFMAELHNTYGAANSPGSAEDIIRHVLSAVADGSRRPGSWEREILRMLGLVADCDEHQTYRSKYGKPDSN